MADIYTIAITLEVNAERALFLMLSADGSINRQGSGTFKDMAHDLFIGKTDPAIFESVRLHLTDDMLRDGEQAGLLGDTFQFDNQRGALCKLELRFFFKDGTSAGSFAFLYGSESEGPPSLLTDVVRAAVRETEPWYQQQIHSDSNVGITADSFKNQRTNSSGLENSLLQAWLSEQCVQLLTSMAKSKGASVRSSGDRLWISGEEIRIRAQIDNVNTDPEKAFVGVGLKLDISVGGVPQPTLTSGVVGAAENRNDALKQAVESWVCLVGEGLLGALGLESETVSVSNYTAYSGMTLVRGSRGSHDAKSPLPSHQDVINGLGSVIESLHSSPSKFHLISILVAVEKDQHGSILVQGECRVDDALSPEAFKAVQSFPWPDGRYILKQYYVLHRR